MAKSKKEKKPTDDSVASAETAVVKPEEERVEPVITDGVGMTVFEGSAGAFVPIDAALPAEHRPAAIRSTLKQTMEVEDRVPLMQGELLYEVMKNSYWKEWTVTDDVTKEERPYATFEEYAETELGMKRRKAFYLMSIYEKFVVELDLPADLLKDLEWSKCIQLRPIITAENASDLLDKISTMSARQVQQFVKDHVGAGSGGTAGLTEGGAEPTTKVSFRFVPEQLENVTNALKIAETMVDSDKTSNQLDLICCEFVASSVGMGAEGALAKLDVVVKTIERAFGVELEVKSIDDDRYKELAETDAEVAASAEA